MIYARPSSTFTALLTGAPTGLVGTLTAGIENVDGTTEVAPASTAIVEVESGIYVATRTAPSDGGDYVFVWRNGATRVGEELNVSEAPPVPALELLPTVDEVASLLRVRTKPRDGQEHLGTFNASTRPTGDQVEELITGAFEDVTAAFVGDVPEESYVAARRAIMFRAAQFVEESYFPEQSADATSLYTPLGIQADAAKAVMVNTANVRALFAETIEEDE